MNNGANTPDDQPADEQLVNALSQWLADHDPLARGKFDRLRSSFVRTVGEPVDHPIAGRNVHLREAEAEAFGEFAFEHDVALAEPDEDARYGDLHGYPVANGTGWVPLLVTTDDSGGVIGAADRIHESYHALEDSTTSTTHTSATANLTHSKTVLTDGGTAPAEREPTPDLNEGALVGLAANDDELAWRYKTALAPDSFKLHDECAEIDGNYYTKTLEVRDWPAIPRHGFFDDIVSFQMPKVDVTLSTHFSGENKHRADQELADSADSLKQRVRSLARNKWIPDYFVDQAAEEYADVKRTQNTISASEYSLYTSHTYIEVRAPDRDTLDTAVERIQSRMQDASASAKELKYHPKEGYQTVAPACKNYLGGKTKMTGDGLARLVPWTASNLIEPGGIELGTNEDTGDPIILDLQNRETGFNVGIWGTIGSGKTTTLTRLFLRLKMKNPEMPLVIIDPKQEFSGFTWLFDGQKVTIGTDTGINPLQIEETPREQLKEEEDEGPFRNAIRRAMDFVRSFYEYQNLPFEDVQDTWRDAITEAYHRRGITDNPETHHKDSPTLKDDVFPIFVEMVRHPENFVNDALTDIDLSTDGMQQRADDILHKHTGALQEDGEFEHLSMETSIDIQNIDVLYLDLQNYENEVTAGLMMGPLLTAVLEQAKEIDEPMGLAMDEFHYMLHNSSSLETLKQAYRHSRHSDLSLITATQSVEEFFTKNDEGERQLTEDASTLTKLMSVKIWHYLEEMDDEWADEFDLTEAEQGHVEDADTGDPTAQALLTLQKGGSYRLAVDYTDKLTPREFAMNQYDPTETEHGTDPLAYLDDYTDRDGKDVTEWTWLGQDDARHGPLSDQSHTGTELADGTTITADVADVDVTPTEEAESATEPSSEQDAAGEGESAADADGDESDGLTSRVKQSVNAAVGSIEGSDTDTSADDTDSGGEGLSLTDIGTVSARTASDLQGGGFETVEAVYRAENSALAEVEGFDESKADFITDQAAKTLDESGVDVEALDAINHDQSPEEPSPAGSFPSEDAAESETDDVPETDSAEQDTNEEATDESGQGEGGVLSKIVSSVSPNHPAAGKSDPDVEVIGIVDAQKAPKLRAAGYTTVLDVYEADPSALAEVEGIDSANADYLHTMAERALEISDASVPASTEDTETESAAESRKTDENDDDQPEEAQSPDASDDDDSANAAEQSSESTDSQPTLTDIREVGGDRADVLREAGYESVKDVAAASESDLTDVEGIGGTRAETIAESAADLLNEQPDGAAAEPAEGDD